MITSYGPVIYIVGSVKIISLLLLHIKDDKKTDNACAETDQIRLAISWSAWKKSIWRPDARDPAMQSSDVELLFTLKYC